MTAFTPAEIRLLQQRMRGAVAGLQQDLNFRRSPLTGRLPHNRRGDIAALVRLHYFYAHLAALAGALAREEALPPDSLAADGLLAFLAEELDLTHAAAAYVTAQPFSRRTKARLLRTLAIEARFFALVIEQLQPREIH